jgi:hypothetical protein
LTKSRAGALCKTILTVAANAICSRNVDFKL